MGPDGVRLGRDRRRVGRVVGSSVSELVALEGAEPTEVVERRGHRGSSVGGREGKERSGV
jgi:hypothetical protein